MVIKIERGTIQIDDGVFYSWIGAVKQEHRAKGIASLLLKFQEDWVLKSGFRKIRVTTYNKYKAMICMLVRNNYQLVKFDPHDEIMRSKLTFEKII